MARSRNPHTDPGRLEDFMRGVDLPAPEVREIVRHLLAGCPRCVAVTGRLWRLGELPRALRILLEEGQEEPAPETVARARPGRKGEP